MTKSNRPGDRSTKCRKVWEACDAWRKRTGLRPTLAEVREVLKNEHDIAYGTVGTQWRRWMKE